MIAPFELTSWLVFRLCEIFAHARRFTKRPYRKNTRFEHEPLSYADCGAV
jgi:hypothetical protein